jgi:hypothetical protein
MIVDLFGEITVRSLLTEDWEGLKLKLCMIYSKGMD